MNVNVNLNEDSTQEDVMRTLVTAIQDQIKHKTMDAEEPYEFYVHKLHLKLFEDPDSVSMRLAKGYRALLAELAREADKET